MKNWKLWVGIITIFLAGNCIGAVGAGLALRHIVVSTLAEGPPAVYRLVTKRLTSKLDLSPTQETAIGKTVFDTQKRILDLRSRYQPEARAIIEESLQQMRKELTPEQQEKLDRIYQRMSSRFAAYKTF